jgi:hypothetical protein
MQRNATRLLTRSTPPLLGALNAGKFRISLVLSPPKRRSRTQFSLPFRRCQTRVNVQSVAFRRSGPEFAYKQNFCGRKSIQYAGRRLAHLSTHQISNSCSGILPHRSSAGMDALPVSTGFVAIYRLTGNTATRSAKSPHAAIQRDGGNKNPRPPRVSKKPPIATNWLCHGR